MTNPTNDTKCRFAPEQHDVLLCLDHPGGVLHADDWHEASRGDQPMTCSVARGESTEATFEVGLSPAQYERLALLAEEMGEALQIVGKILRHGYDSSNPLEEGSRTNRALLEKELGDVRHAMIRLCEASDLNKQEIHDWADAKRENVKKWLHFNE